MHTGWVCILRNLRMADRNTELADLRAMRYHFKVGSRGKYSAIGAPRPRQYFSGGGSPGQQRYGQRNSNAWDGRCTALTLDRWCTHSPPDSRRADVERITSAPDRSSATGGGTNFGALGPSVSLTGGACAGDCRPVRSHQDLLSYVPRGWRYDGGRRG